MEYRLKRLESYRWCHSLIIINAVALSKPFSNIVDLIVNNATSVIAFALADQFALQWVLSTG